MPTNSEFDAVYCDGNMSVQRQQSNLGKAGEPHGQVSPYAPETPAVAADNYPNVFNYGYDSQNREFSSDKSATPAQFASDTAASQSNFADLQTYLMNSLDTPGCRVAHDQRKPWTPPHGAEGE